VERAIGAMQGRQTVRRFASIGIVALHLVARAQPAEAESPVTRVHGIATGLAACWRPPHDDDQVTLRVSFTREGAVIGEPRIVFVRSSVGWADDAALADSMMSAIRDCTPLHFSARLGSAIAGQVLAIRFIGRSRATIVAPHDERDLLRCERSAPSGRERAMERAAGYLCGHASPRNQSQIAAWPLVRL
jgi:hypothetical protein